MACDHGREKDEEAREGDLVERRDRLDGAQRPDCGGVPVVRQQHHVGQTDRCVQQVGAQQGDREREQLANGKARSQREPLPDRQAP